MNSSCDTAGTLRHGRMTTAPACRPGPSGLVRRLLQAILMLATAFVLAACGGGSSPATEVPADDLNLVGTASAETALAGATVAVRCAAGQAQTVTASDGSFAVSLRSAVLPCMVEVGSGGRLFRSLVTGPGPGTYRVNAGPLTELMVARIASAFGGTPADMFTSFDARKDAVTPAALASALSYLRAALAALVDLASLNPLSDLMVAASGSTTANDLGSKASALLTKLGAANATLETLVTAFVTRPSDPTPLLPAVTTDPVSVTVLALQPATFSVVAASLLDLRYQWQVSTDGGTSFSDLPGATAASYTLPSAQPIDGNSMYRVRLDSAGGSVTSRMATLSVTVPVPVAPLIAVQPQSTSAQYGQPATFSVDAGSAPHLTYQWRRDGAPIAGATAATYVLPMTVSGDTGASFAVVVSNASGSTLSTSATLTVTGIPAAVPSRAVAGASHSVLIRGDGTLLSWGNIKADIGTSLSGLMGVGSDPVTAGVPTVAKTAGGTPFNGARAVAAGQWSTLVLKTDGTVWGWGYSGWGNLGNSSSFSFEQKSPVQVRLTDGTALTSVTQLAAGTYSTSMAVTSDGSVWGWGQNRYGHLGIGSASESGQRTAVAMLSPSGSGRFTGAVQAAVGISSSAVLRTDGTVYTMGWAGPLGDDSTLNRTLPGRVETAPGVPLSKVVSIAAGGHFYIAVTTEGTAYVWGTNNKGQLGDGTVLARGRPVLVRDADGKPMTGIVAAAAGDDFAMFLKSDGTVWASGNNDIGQLGAGSNAAYSTTPLVVKDAGGAVFGDVVSLSALSTHTVVQRRDGTVWIWGNNTYLQLGDGTAVNRRNPIRAQ